MYSYDKDTGLLHGKQGRPIGSIHPDGYVYSSINGKRRSVHRFIFELVLGKELPDDIQVDHINHDKTDNRWDNLRLVTRSEQMKNLSKFKNNTSGTTGVNWHKGGWRAKIGVDGKPVHLGRFATYSGAVDARKLAEVAYGYHSNHGKD